MVETTDSVRLRDHTWRDVEAYLADADHPTVFVPIGSTEQHGPHLPLGVDALQAETVAEGIAEAAGGLAAPLIPYGDADHHMRYPGTVSLSSDTVVAVLEDVYRSLLDHGFETVITVNGHRLANLAAIELAAESVKEARPGSFFATIDLVRVAVDAHRRLRDGDPEDGMHGGEFETSFMLFTHPDLVREDAIDPAVEERWTRFVSEDFTALDDRVELPSASHDPVPDAPGHRGDPTHASAAKGEALYDATVDDAVEFVEDLRAHRAADTGTGIKAGPEPEDSG
jgi:creatinine amidohydrolase